MVFIKFKSNDYSYKFKVFDFFVPGYKLSGFS